MQRIDAIFIIVCACELIELKFTSQADKCDLQNISYHEYELTFKNNIYLKICELTNYYIRVIQFNSEGSQ